MTITSIIVVFSLSWWILLFIALPIGVRTEENPEPGHAVSAPANPNLKKKMLWVTLISILLTGAWLAIVESRHWSIKQLLGVTAWDAPSSHSSQP